MAKLELFLAPEVFFIDKPKIFLLQFLPSQALLLFSSKVLCLMKHTMLIKGIRADPLPFTMKAGLIQANPSL